MKNQILRNLTTGRLNTEMSDVHEAFEFFIGDEFVTHQLPNALTALTPILKRKIKEGRYWDGEYDVDHKGEYEILPLNKDERDEFYKGYLTLPDPLSQIGMGTCVTKSPC